MSNDIEVQVNEVPTLREELNRKAVDALVWLQTGLEDGSLSVEQVYCARQALFTALAGLLDNDINDLLVAEPLDNKPARQEILVKNKVITVLTLDRSQVHVNKMAIANESELSKPCSSSVHAERLYSEIKGNLITKGNVPFRHQRSNCG